MNIFTRVLFDIFTFGIFEIILHAKAKKVANIKNSELTYSKTYKFNINNFINDLGGIDNIENVSSTLSSVKINLKKINLIIADLQKKYQIKGITKSNNVLILIFGDNAKTIAENIEKLLKTK
ncbi:MAG: hypothetical protein IJK72_02010 [Mycoplasma sp.]|nr:hypothetical protein [Mycoplasma sp.]